MKFSSPLRFPLSSVPSDFGRSLRAARLARHWTQARLAKGAGLRRETVARLECGGRRPAADTVFRLEAALGLDGGLVPAWPEWKPIGLPSMGARSRERRRDLGLSLEAVAGLAGVSAATLSRFEREFQWNSASILDTSGDKPSSEEATRLARALGFSSAPEHAAWCTRV
jgi:transcriptional regulator with XRE-family HTH domain